MKKAVPIKKITASALAGLILFFAVESAVSRYIGFSLFLPVREGAFLFGRVLRLCAALAVSCAATMTDRGEKLRRAVDTVCEKDWARWLTAAIVTGLFFLWAARVTVISFMTNDDVSLMQSIALVPSQGLSAVANTFSTVPFCAMLGLFYRLDPGGYWYGGYHIAVIAVSLTVIGRCVLLTTRRGGWPVWAGCAIHALLCAGVFFHTIAGLSFTVTPAVAGTAAVALILCRSDTENRLGHILMDAGSVVLMFLCVSHRYSTGRCLMCFWALAMAYQLLKAFLAGNLKKRLLPLALCAAVTVGIFYAVPRVTVRVPADSTSTAATADDSYSYSTAEYYRSMVMDYLVENLTDEQLEAAGLPPELSALLRAWYFMDERINTDTFKTITQMYYSADAPFSDGMGALESATSTESLGLIYAMKLLALFMPLLLALAVLSLIRHGRRYWPELLCALGAAGGAVILWLYLILEGRFLLRVFLVVALPAVVTLLLMALSRPEKQADNGPRPAVKAFSTVIVAALSVLCVLSAHSAPYAAEAADWDAVHGGQAATEAYVSDHPDIYFVTNLTAHNLDPFHDGLSSPSNMGLWGGTGVTASSNRLYADAFFRDDILFIYDPPSSIVALLQYLSLDFGPVQSVTVTQLPATTTVGDIDRVTPGEDYTGWYEQNGMTYYFDGGEAVTGTQVIDGTEYTFAPAGADAQLVIVPSPDGIVYTTDAYSLIG